MPALGLIDLAFRARLATLVCATTGSTTLSATASGYRRTSGSFLVDGFGVGMQITPNGFASNPVSVVTHVTATELHVRDTRTAQPPASGRTITAGLPRVRLWGNEGIAPPPNEPFVETDLIGQAGTQLSFPSDGGIREDLGLYIVRWFALPRTGTTPIRTCTDAVQALFAPGTVMLLSDGSNVRVRGDVAPTAGGFVRVDSGHVMQVVTIPWRRYAANAVL